MTQKFIPTDTYLEPIGLGLDTACMDAYDEVAFTINVPVNPDAPVFTTVMAVYNHYRIMLCNFFNVESPVVIESLPPEIEKSFIDVLRNYTVTDMILSFVYGRHNVKIQIAMNAADFILEDYDIRWIVRPVEEVVGNKLAEYKLEPGRFTEETIGDELLKIKLEAVELSNSIDTELGITDDDD